MINRFLIALFLFFTAACETSHAQRAVILVRHSERLDSSADSPLSIAGEDRAARLANHLKDAGITAIYTTQFQRTIKTAEPLAKALGISSRIVAAAEQSKLIGILKTQGPNDVILVVGHSNTVPALLKELGATATITIADDQYSDLFILIPQTDRPEPILLHLRY